jgi:uncharacterized cupredoxin-like copper-binding protein
MRRGRHLAWLLVVASACSGASAASPPTPETVTLVVHHSAFTPRSFTVAAGTTVRIVVRNTDPIDHELIVGDQAVQDRHERGTEAHHGAIPGEVSVPAGAAVETTYSFDGPGPYLFGCHLPGHWDYGMRGTVELTPRSR